MRTEAETQQVRGSVISRDLLPLLGVQPVLGRNFTDEDAQQDTVVIGYGLWQSLFGGDPSVVGRTIELTGTPAGGKCWTHFASTSTGFAASASGAFNGQGVREPQAPA